MAFWTPFFPFGLKCKHLSRLHVMISVRTFLPEIKTISSSFFKSIYIFDIFYHFYQFEHTKSEVWKGKNLCALGVKLEGSYTFSHDHTLHLWPYNSADIDVCGYGKKSEFTGREPDGKTRNEENCWNYTGCICEDGFKWSDYRNPVTGQWDWVCVPDDRCEDLKICKGDEDYVECPHGTETMCIDNQVIWGVNHPSKVAIDGAACLGTFYLRLMTPLDNVPIWKI